MAKDITIKISQEDHRWLSNKSEETQVNIKSIVGLALKKLRGEPETQMMQIFRDNKGGKI